MQASWSEISVARKGLTTQSVGELNHTIGRNWTQFDAVSSLKQFDAADESIRGRTQFDAPDAV